MTRLKAATVAAPLVWAPVEPVLAVLALAVLALAVLALVVLVVLAQVRWTTQSATATALVPDCWQSSRANSWAKTAMTVLRRPTRKTLGTTAAATRMTPSSR